MTIHYMLPDLPYALDALSPWCPAETLQLHHGKHHAAYVNEANAAAEALSAIDPAEEAKLGALQASLTFNLSGHLLHSLFWRCLTPASGRPSGVLAEQIRADFGSFDRFSELLTTTCVKVQGSGWGALLVDPETGSLRVAAIHDHSSALIPGANLIAVIDVWEHAYYLTHNNDRASWVDAVIDHLDWESIAQRAAASSSSDFVGKGCR